MLIIWDLPKQVKSETHTHTPKDALSYQKIIVALFTITRTLTKPKFPTIEELIKRIDKGNLHNGVLLKCKNNDIMRFEGKWFKVEKKHLI